MKKLILEMSNTDLQITLDLYNNQPTKEIYESISDMQKWTGEVERKFNVGFQNYKVNLKVEIDGLMDNYKKIVLPPKMDDNTQKLLFLTQKKESKERQLRVESILLKEI